MRRSRGPRPTVTFLVTVYNDDRFLAEALLSIQRQVGCDVEAVVTLDGCTDASESIARNIAEEDSRVRLIAMPHVGRARALNIAGAHARGEYLAILDADDVAAPDRARISVSALKANPHFDLLGFDHLNFADRLEFPEPVVGQHPGFDVTKRLRRHNPFAHSSVIVHRETFLEIGGYNVQRTRQVDYDLFVRLARQGGRIGFVPVVTVGIRRHGDSHFLGSNRLQYRWGHVQVQREALSCVAGPKRDYLYLSGRVAGIALPQRWVSVAGRRLVR